MFLTVIVSSMYLFPFEFSFLPGMNTKMLLGGLGLIILTIQLAKKQDALIDYNIFSLSVIAILISLTALFLSLSMPLPKPHTSLILYPCGFGQVELIP